VTIEFHCPFCQKLLKTPDDKAGVRANCPGCGEVVTVPSPEQEAAHAEADFGTSDSLLRAPHAERGVTTTSDRIAVDEDGAPGQIKTCPMCGAQIKAAANRCRFCGESFVNQTGDRVPSKIDGGESVSDAWPIYKNNLGILAATTLIMGVVWLALHFAEQLAQGGISFLMMGRAGGQPPDDIGQTLAVFGVLFFFETLKFAIVDCYLQSGYRQMLLKIARGENAEVSDLFAGGRFFWRVFWASVLVSLMSTVGFMMLVVPGVFVMLIFWPYFFVIIDRDVGIVESFRVSAELTSGNYLAGLLLGLVWTGCWFGGLAACCVGLIFTYPLALLALTVAYCRMSGQVVAKS